MATKIVTKNSSTASAVPTASDLLQGELAVNVADKRLFTEDNAGAIVELGTNPSTLTVTGEITANGGIALGDNDKATFGDGDDLQIYHDGSNSYIKDAGTGDLILNVNNFRLKNAADSEIYLYAQDGGGVNLYHTGNAIKLATTSTGIDVTGTVTMDGLTVDGTNGAYTIASNGNDFYYGRNGANYHIAGTANGAFNFLTGASSANRLKIANNGDIQFFEDTGTTAKLHWDSSAESLGIGSSPTRALDVSKAGSTILANFKNTGGATSFITLGNTTSTADQIRIGSDGADLTLSTNYAERMRISSDGSVLVGKTASGLANSGFEVGQAGQINVTQTGATVGRFNRKTSDGSILEIAKDGTTVGSIGVISSDNLFITGGVANHSGLALSQHSVLPMNGSSYSTGTDDLGSSGNRFKDLYLSGGAYVGGVYNTGIYNQQSGDIQFWVPNVGEAVRIQQNTGNLLVGTTNDTGTNAEGFIFYDGSGSSRLYIGHVNGTANGTQFAVFNYNSGKIGDITQSGTTAVLYNTSSDQRLKENIADADDSGSKIDSIQVRKFDWKADGSHQDYGMIAQELQAVAPEAVSGDADSEEMMGVDYSKLVPMLIKEIQSLRNRVAQLEE